MRLLFAAMLSFAALTTAAASAEQAPAPERSCFASSSWTGWSAVDEGNALYLRIRNDDIYRVELTPGSHAREAPGRFLVSEVRGSGWICSALDLDLSLSDRIGFRQPLIATSIRKLSPEEVAAIPREDLPG